MRTTFIGEAMVEFFDISKFDAQQFYEDIKSACLKHGILSITIYAKPDPELLDQKPSAPPAYRRHDP